MYTNPSREWESMWRIVMTLVYPNARRGLESLGRAIHRHGEGEVGQAPHVRTCGQ